LRISVPDAPEREESRLANVKAWIEVVPPLPQLEAERRFQEWRAANPGIAGGLRDDDVRLDVIRSNEGRTLFRYRVKLE